MKSAVAETLLPGNARLSPFVKCHRVIFRLCSFYGKWVFAIFLLFPSILMMLDCDLNTADSYRGSPSHISFYCKSSRQIFVASNYSSVPLQEWTFVEPVQVMIGYTSDISDIVSRTETPVMLMPGMNLVGFAYQHRVRRFRSPTLATLGLFQVRTSIIDFVMITDPHSFV